MASFGLPKLVRIYKRKHGRCLVAYLGYYRRLTSLEDAIRYACHGRKGKIHGHQHLVGRAKLEQARKKLRKDAAKVQSCKSFHQLLTLVEDCTRSIDRFGVLAVYDTSLRLGAYLGLWPKVVYLHAGTRKGCKALGLTTKGGTIEMDRLPKPLRVLRPHQAEDFLCIFKDQFGRAGGKADGSLTREC